jgi:EAL domain-containing protein (putative c-di-GMP-specific phosphodiesterase class I)
VLPKLRTLKDFRISVNLSASAETAGANELRNELRQIIEDLGLTGSVTVD